MIKSLVLKLYQYVSAIGTLNTKCLGMFIVHNLAPTIYIAHHTTTSKDQPQTRSFIDECLSRNNTNKNMFDLTPTTLHHQAKQDICRYREQSSSRISFCNGGTSKQSGKLSLFFLEKKEWQEPSCVLSRSLRVLTHKQLGSTHFGWHWNAPQTFLPTPSDHKLQADCMVSEQLEWLNTIMVKVFFC